MSGSSLSAMQPIYEVTITRPWHWGIVAVSAPNAPVPESLGDALVVGNSDGIVLCVRHAQDIEAETFEGDGDWATATVHLRSLTQLDSGDGEVLYEGELSLPEGRLTIGDADSEVAVNDLEPRTRLRVRAMDAAPTGLTEAWIDLYPAG